MVYPVLTVVMVLMVLMEAREKQVDLDPRENLDEMEPPEVLEPKETKVPPESLTMDPRESLVLLELMVYLVLLALRYVCSKSN